MARVARFVPCIADQRFADTGVAAGDLEMVQTFGVHGSRSVDVVLVEIQNEVSPSRRMSRLSLVSNNVEIVAALFIEDVNFRQAGGGPTRIDITGAYFSTKVEAFPCALTPHLLVLLRAESDEGRNGTLEVTFVRAEQDGEEAEQVGRSRQPVYINPPGTFFRQLVRPELSFDGPGSVEARCLVPETGSKVTVPLTVIG